MPVSRLRTRRDVRQEGGIAQLRDVLLDASETVPEDVLGRLVHLLDRELSSRRGWRFVMVEPELFHDLVVRLTTDGASARPAVAVRVLTALFRCLPPDSNEVDASRSEIAEAARCRPEEVSRAIRELESIGAVYRRQEGRGVRYFVHPSHGTHLTGAARDRAQAEAPKLRLVEPA
jgi:hypothetical protein